MDGHRSEATRDTAATSAISCQMREQANESGHDGHTRMKIFLFLKDHLLAVFLSVLLLTGCVICDLSIPKLTSEIVDVGIQQSGMEHIATDQMTDETHSLIGMMLPATDEAIFADAYAQDADTGLWHLTDAGRAERDALDEMLTFPMVALQGAQKMGGGATDIEQVLQAVRAGTMDEGQVRAYVEAAREEMALSPDMMAQMALSQALKEEKAAGADLPQIQLAYLLKTGGAMIGLAALSMVLNILVGLVASRTGSQIGHDLRERLFSRVVSFSDAEIARFSAASLITRGTNDIQLVQNVTIMILRMVLYAPIVAIGGIVMVLATNASLGWIIVVAVAIVAAVILILFRVTGPKFKIMQYLIDKVNLVAREMLTGISVIRAFGREGYEQDRFDTASRKLMRTQLFTNRAMSFMMPAMMLVMNLTSVAIVWFGGHYIQDGIIQTGDMIAFITYSMVIIMGFLMIGMVSIMLPRADVAAERVMEVLSCEPSIVDPEEPAVLAQVGKGARIQFDHVFFRYPGSSECALSDVTFSVEPGQTLALIGATGSGKSTVLKLLERFYDVSGGSILLDGCDVRSIKQEDLRRSLGFVPQKGFLFSGTIDTNVAYADESMTEARVTEALALAQAKEFVDAKPEGSDAPIAQGGTNVSGGQRQRLCVARALATGARAYLFDDSFSALDYKTDADLRHGLARELEGVTKVIVAQRISTVRDADVIVVLKDGRNVGQGSHAYLMEHCGEYERIALSQLSEEELALGGDAA